MITSLKFKSIHSVKVGSTGKFKLASGDEVFQSKEIPAVRYHFETYGDEEKAFIDRMMGLFPDSLHVVECGIDKMADTMYYLQSYVNRVVFICHMDLTDRHAQTKVFNDIEVEKLTKLATLPVNRLVFDDKSTCLDYIGYSTLSTTARKITRLKKDDTGICSSPFTDSENCCMSAAKTREWAAKYVENPDIALPSANHNNCDHCCGCFRYETVECDIIAVESERATSEFKEMNSPDTKEEKKEPKEKKQSKPKTKFAPEWKGSLLSRRK